MAFSLKLVAGSTTKNQALNAKEKKLRDDEKAPTKADKMRVPTRRTVISIPCGYFIVCCNKDPIEATI